MGRVNDGAGNWTEDGLTPELSVFRWDGSAYVRDRDVRLFQGPSTADPKTATGGRDQVGDIWSTTDSESTVKAGQILGYKSYNPNVLTAVNTTTTVYADVDATNLAVAFTVPASGAVLVTLEAIAIGGNTCKLGWGLRDGTTDIVGKKVTDTSSGMGSLVHAEFVITGLTPGATKTYKWSSARIAGTTTGVTQYGQTGIGLEAGPAIMKVVAL